MKFVFIVEIRDYEAGRSDRTITSARVERAVQAVLDQDGSDGVVVVTEEQGDA